MNYYIQSSYIIYYMQGNIETIDDKLNETELLNILRDNSIKIKTILKCFRILESGYYNSTIHSVALYDKKKKLKNINDYISLRSNKYTFNLKLNDFDKSIIKGIKNSKYIHIIEITI